MGMCSNVKKSPKHELENSIKQDKPHNEITKKNLIPPEEEEVYKDMEEWEGNLNY
jgi:hypothetical protein